MRLILSLIPLVIILLLAGCVNPYERFYQSNSGGQPAVSLEGYQPCDGPIQIFSSSNMKDDIQELFRRGFVPVGHSSFEGTASVITESNVMEEAKKVSACKVLVASKYSHTISGAMPLTVPNNSTSYTTGTASAYGSGGYANAYGNSTTTTYGTQTVMMPYSVQRYDAAAVYFIKKKLRFGANLLPVPPELSKQIGHNGGLLIAIIVRGGAAYQADIFEGDVVMSIDGSKLNAENNVELFNSLTKEKAGQTVNIEIWRNGETINKSVTLGI